MVTDTSAAPEPDFAAAATASGEAVLACWPDLPGWHHAVWAAPHGCEPHWCIEGRWTPGSDPVGFMPMPERHGIPAMMTSICKATRPREWASLAGGRARSPVPGAREAKLEAVLKDIRDALEAPGDAIDRVLNARVFLEWLE